MHKSNFFRSLVLTASCLFLFSATIRAELPLASAAQDNEEKIGKLLTDSGYNVRKTGKGTWVIARQNKEMGVIQVLVASGADFVVTGVIIAFKKNMSASPEMMRKLLKLNHSLDYVKVGFDDDDDLFVRSEMKSKFLDAADLKAEIERVCSYADKVFLDIKPYLVN